MEAEGYAGIIDSSDLQSQHCESRRNVTDMLDEIKNLANLTKEIAAKLVIAERTVKFHINSIFGKLGAGNRTEAVTTTIQQGLVEL